jgi:hypothetical protein
MRLKGIVVRWSPILLLAIAPFVMAQETAEPAAADEQPAQTEQAEPQATPPPEPAKKGKAPFSLYVEAGGGAYAPDDIDPSIETLSTHYAKNTMSWEDQDMARVAIGWKLQRNRGDFRLIFNGYKETGYELESIGMLAAVDQDLGTQPDVLGPLPWWQVNAKNGDVHSERWPPVWDQALDDANGNGFIDPGEQRYTDPDLVLDTKTFANMQNRAQTYDFVFGNVWGPRRVQGRWFGGMRYFLYEGNIPAGAWLLSQPTGEGYTEGSLLRLINFSQKSQGLGPTGLMEVRFNFFDQILQLYANGQATFMVMDLEMDTGLFMTLVEKADVGATIPIAARLSESQTKSTWQTGAEVGLRVRLRNGLKLEASYGIVGLLDVIVLPTQIRIPDNEQEAAQGTSAIYNTQDYVLSGWRAGIAFQF